MVFEMMNMINANPPIHMRIPPMVPMARTKPLSLEVFLFSFFFSFRYKASRTKKATISKAMPI